MKIRYIIVLLLMLLEVVVAEDYRTIQRDTPIVTSDRKSHKTIEDFGEYHAILIYLENYTSLRPKLTTPKKDVEDLAKILEERYFFKKENIVFVPEPKSSYELKKVFDDAISKLKEDDNLLIYYAGHGSLSDDNSTAYWNLLNAEKGKTAGSIDVDIAVKKVLLSLKSKHVVVISDSCYSGHIARGDNPNPFHLSKNEREYYGRLYRKRSRTVFTSGGLEEVRDKDVLDRKHSPFAKSLLRMLRDNEEPIFALNEKYKEVTSYVINNSNQTPEYAPIPKLGNDISADFIFIDKKSIYKNKDIKPTRNEDDYIPNSKPISLKQNVSQIDNILVWALGIVSLLLLTISVIYYKTRKKIPLPKDEEGDGSGNKGTTPPHPPPPKIEGTLNMGKLTYQNQPFTKQYTWQEAKEYAKNLRLGGFDDWRLPTLKELRALGNIELYNGEDSEPFWHEWYQNHKDNALQNSKGEKHFVNEKLVDNMPKNSIFWTLESKDEYDMYLVAFHLGCNYVEDSTSKHYVLCVRDNKEGEK